MEPGKHKGPLRQAFETAVLTEKSATIYPALEIGTVDTDILQGSVVKTGKFTVGFAELKELDDPIGYNHCISPFSMHKYVSYCTPYEQSDFCI
jgi:hypothetical protein